MAITNLHRLDKFILPSATAIDYVNNVQWSNGADVLMKHPSGHTHPMFGGTVNQAPSISASTPQISTFLALVPVNGLAFTADVDSYFKQMTATGNTARASAVHTKVTIAEGMLHWTTVNLTHNAESTVDFVLTASYDGTNDPIVDAGTTALSGNLAAGEMFGAGNVVINGTTIGEIQSVTISSGVQLLIRGDASNLWPDFVAVQTTNPTITITTNDIDVRATAGIDGVALNGSTGVVCYARQFTNNMAGGVGRVANLTATHVAFTALNGHYRVDSSGDGTDPVSSTITVNTTSVSDSVLPITINTTSTHP